MGGSGRWTPDQEPGWPPNSIVHSTSLCSSAPPSQAFVSSVALASMERGRRARRWGACITLTASSVTPVVGNTHPSPLPLSLSCTQASARGIAQLWGRGGCHSQTFSLCTWFAVPWFLGLAYVGGLGLRKAVRKAPLRSLAMVLLSTQGTALPGKHGGEG